MDIYVSNFIDIWNSNNYDLLPYSSNSMIDGNQVLEPTLHITGTYLSNAFYSNPNYMVKNVIPEPEQTHKHVYWEEDLQLIPTLVFHDLNYDRASNIKTWFGGIMIAVGSGLITLPFF